MTLRPWRLRLLPAFAVALALTLACGDTPAPIPRPELVPVPHPTLEGIEEAARTALEGQRQSLDDLLAAAGTSNLQLAAAFGRLGQLYQAYELPTAALACYDNARRLDVSDYRWSYLPGVLHQTTGDQQQAASSLELALQLADGNPATLLRRAQVHLALGQPRQAETRFRQLLENQEFEAAAQLGLGRALAAVEEHETAVASFERALELQPQAGSVRYPLAQSYRKLGREEEARQLLADGANGEVFFPDPVVETLRDLAVSGGALMSRGSEALVAGRLEEAEDFYRRAVDTDPELFEARRNLALAQLRQERPEDARQTLEEAIRRHPEEASLHFDLANASLAAGRGEEALRAFRKTLELQPDHTTAHFNLANALMGQGQWKEAETHLRRVLELDPTERRARYQLTMSRYNQGLDRQGLTELRQLVRDEPDLMAARFSLASILFQRGNLRGARQQYEEITRVAEDPEEAASAHTQIAAVAARQGRTDEAMAALDAALRLAPELPEALLNRASLLQQLGRGEEATQQYIRLVEASPDHVEGQRRLGASLIVTGRYAEAKRRLEAAIEAIPSDAALSDILARLLATCPDDEVRDGARALQLAQQAYASQRTLEHAETLAMALAEVGDFRRAASVQQGLITQLQQRGDGRQIGRLQTRLNGYLKGQAVRIE